MTQNAMPPPHAKNAYSTTGTDHELDNDPQRKESDGGLSSEEDSDWVDESDEEREAHRRPEKANTRHTTGPSRNPMDSVLSSPKSWHLLVTSENYDETRDVVLKALSEGAIFSAQYVLSILKAVGHIAQWQITFYTASVLLMITMGYISTTLQLAFQPLCVIPGISSPSLCNPDPRSLSSTNSTGNSTPKWADYSKLMAVQTQSFEQLLGDVAGGSALALEIKKAEIATSNLVALVRVSDLKAKDTLAKSLSEFVKDGKKTARSLQKMTSKVNGAVDNIMAVNDYALQSIASARKNEPSPLSLKRLIPWAAPTQRVDYIVRRTFDEAMNVLSTNMERLIIEAEHNIHNLNNLEEQLATIHGIIAREDVFISSAKADLLESLWTTLSENRKSLRNYEYHLLLLKGLGMYRKQALTHVVAALQTLHAMSEDMEDMRERVAAPDLMGGTVPVEVHIKSIQTGLERLGEGRLRAKKLQADAARKILMADD